MRGTSRGACQAGHDANGSAEGSSGGDDEARYARGSDGRGGDGKGEEAKTVATRPFKRRRTMEAGLKRKAEKPLRKAKRAAKQQAEAT